MLKISELQLLIGNNVEKFLSEKKFLRLTKRPWVRNDYIPNEQRCILLLETGEQRFPLLLGMNNALRIFMVLSETKSALVIKISQRYCLFTVWNSDLFSICFFGRLDFFFRATLLKFRATWLRFRATWPVPVINYRRFDQGFESLLSRCYLSNRWSLLLRTSSSELSWGVTLSGGYGACLPVYPLPTCSCGGAEGSGSVE